VNQKGGVGKSTTAVNLGAALAIRGQRVLVVDSDPQGNTTTGFGIDKGRIERDVYDVLMQQATIAEVIQPSEIEGLDVVPATINLAGAEIELVSGLSRETRMRTALAPIADSYDYTLIDCPPSLGLLTINALTAAREIIIPVQAEYYALEGLSQLTNVVRRVREALNPTLHVSGVLVTMFDGRTRLAMEVLDELAKYFPEQMFKTQIPRNIRLSEAPSYGKPVILFDIKSRGAQAYISLAKEMLDAMPAAAGASAG
jgi:chromosome partitioning protein